MSAKALILEPLVTESVLGTRQGQPLWAGDPVSTRQWELRQPFCLKEETVQKTAERLTEDFVSLTYLTPAHYVSDIMFFLQGTNHVPVCEELPSHSGKSD